MVESVKALNDPKMFGLFKSMVTKWNIKKMIQIIGSMVKDIVNEFKGLTVEGLDLGLILGDPETITQKNKIIDKGVGEKGNSLGRDDKTITVTKKPRMGIIEAVTTIISSMLQLVQTKFGLRELIRFRINAWLFAKMWKVTFEVFLKQFKDFDKDLYSYKAADGSSITVIGLIPANSNACFIRDFCLSLNEDGYVITTLEKSAFLHRLTIISLMNLNSIAINSSTGSNNSIMIVIESFNSSCNNFISLILSSLTPDIILYIFVTFK